ncbi:glycosyltransferase family 2 protein [Jiangella gansuensis]|uniref:glycosyltransferase family 2 protein n=1 Tax=Jiangella gansuensis TaxID=281473 RepID=UPI0004B835A9|nr:glycosyltransferase [Jiangella gansuensis]
MPPETASVEQLDLDTRRRPPRVTLGMPLYNAERYLAQAFDGLLAQDFGDFEIVVSDNASTDGTWSLCQDYAARDPRIRLYRNTENLGAARNYNRTVELARAPLFKWVAYDDVCSPTLLSRCVAALDAAGPRVVLAYPRTLLIDDDGVEIGPYRDGLDLRSSHAFRRVATYARNWSLCNAVFGVIRTDVLRSTGMIRPYLSSDVVLLAELAAIGQFHEIPERLFHRRIHAGSSRQSGKDLAAAAHWFDTRRPADARPPKVRLPRRVTSALLSAPLAWHDRIGSAAAFLSVWGYRKTHIRASHLKHALLDRTRAPATKEAP